MLEANYSHSHPTKKSINFKNKLLLFNQSKNVIFQYCLYKRCFLVILTVICAIKNGMVHIFNDMKRVVG